MRPTHLASSLLRKQRVHILKRLKFNRVAGRVEEEHGGLFAGFAFEADVWFDDELRAGGLQALGEFVPLLHAEHDAEVAAGDVVAVNVARFGHRAFVGREVRDDLVAVEIEVHPMRAGAAFFAAEEIKIERAAGVEIVGREGEVEGLDGHGGLWFALRAGYGLDSRRPSAGLS